MAKYLLDTNHASRVMAQDELITARVQQARFSGDQFGISMTVLAELYYAVYASQRRQENLRRLQGLVGALILWPFDELAAEAFGIIQAEQKASGRPIPPLDAQIAAVARTHGLAVLTADQHFQFIAGLAVQNWLG